MDRGPNSKGNIDFLLQTQKENPNQIYLLKGNHETYKTQSFFPTNFWENLTHEESEKYSTIFGAFPFAVSVGEIIALHGALPDINSLEEINKIENSRSDEKWYHTIWGDCHPQDSNANYIDFGSGRPKLGENYFKRVMENIDKKVLIRSHDYHTPEQMFNNQCLTLFTSSAHPKRRRTIAIADFDKNSSINSIDDLIIEEI